MKKKDESKPLKPILYISQPNLKEPNHRMQSQYTSNADQLSNLNSSDAIVAAGKTKTTKRSISYFEEEEFIFEEKKNAQEKQVEEKQVEEKQPQKQIPVSAADYFRFHAQNNSPVKGRLNPVKSFTSMTIEEKLQHLSSKPQFYSCTFSTLDKGVTGKLHAGDQNQIVVKTDSGEFITINKKELTGIRINA
ncbi:hypothetical protein J6TS1_36880 [Siminovitchia terrae]|uniref:Spore coat protein CotO n=1 Tax=Siminovitchia terrae TaxID=1914933 RepID=A0ABQ4L0M7_SIMTE|nr:CotO family spore coat protein [Siminovitchia terrae]GIN89903.1 hypothetical protein J22TS1_09540 [Siminovitchia terrae]GIN97818.1 hypothetical protein J6TS1_36880 [Siminovitchia terrae]